MKHLYLLGAFCLIALLTSAQMVSVTFNVNMANEDTSPDGVYLAGGADFGIPGTNPMTDDDGDDVWTITVQVESGYTGYYTFTNGACADWSCKESIAGQDCAAGQWNDRELVNITADTEINTCFAQCTTDGSCPNVGGPMDITFRVDMSQQVVSPNGVFMSGTFDGWCGTCTALTDPDGDGIYTVTLPQVNPGNFEWKFLNGGWGSEEIFDPATDGECTLTTGDFTNRFLVVNGDTPSELEVFCFNSCYQCGTAPLCVDSLQIDSTMMCNLIYDPVCGCNGVTYSNECEATFYGGVTSWTAGECATSAMVTFQVNMQDEDILGPIYVTGNSVDGWCGTCVEMTDDDGDGIFAATVELESGDHEYKYNNGGWDGTEMLDSLDSACTLTTIDGPNVFINRLLTFLPGSGELVLPPVCFNSCDDCVPIEEPTSASVTFNVDLSEQDVTGTIYISGATIDGWAGTTVAMADDDGDNVYSVTLDMEFGDHEYKYMIGSWDTSEQLDAVEDAECTLTTGGFTNRLLTVTSADTLNLDVVCYGACTPCGGTNGLIERDAFGFTVYPSVTDGLLTLELNAGLDRTANIVVLDMAGRAVLNDQLFEGATRKQIDLGAQADGFYLIRLEYGNANSTEMVIKKN